MKAPLYILGCVIILSVLSCKKLEQSQDVISTHTIHGQVYNLCTDSGLAGVTVLLNINDKNGGGLTLTAISGTNGIFSFSNVQIHSGSDYTYVLEVVSDDGAGYKPGISGTQQVISIGNSSIPIILDVFASFKTCKLYFPHSTQINTQDTFLLTLSQPIFHKNSPQGNYSLVSGSGPSGYSLPSGGYYGEIGPYWMGWWHSSLDRTINGVHTIKTDSFYVGWGASVTDTIPW